MFGPVPSRRLGRSLGIDTVPLKTCNWNCVYCQLGRSQPMTNERKEYVPREVILAEFRNTLSRLRACEMDWVTFVASGEPALHAGLGALIRGVKDLTDRPVAVITNGSLLSRPEVREEMGAADAVLPTLDAGSAELQRRINRPHPALRYEEHVEGLRVFRQSYAGKLWIEVMLVRGLNDGEAELRELASVLRSIRPDRIHLLVPTRPPAESWVEPPDEEGLMRAAALLGDVTSLLHPAEGEFDLGEVGDVVEAVLTVITRHPMREDQLTAALGRHVPGEEVRRILADLLASGRVQVVERYGHRFFSAAPSRYADRPRR